MPPPRSPRRAVLLLVVLLLAVAGGCSSSAKSGAVTPTVPPVAFATAAVQIGPRTLHVEVASDAAQSERGLGYRDSLAADDGMIFDLHGALVPQFWMKGMRFALDLVWIDEKKSVASVTKGVPPEPGVADAALKRYAPATAMRWVIEVNSGAADRLGLTPGTQLAFEIPAPGPS